MTPRRRSLRVRLALWVTLSTTLTLVVFAVTAFALVVLESRERPASDEGAELEDAREQVLFAMLFAAPLCLAISVGGAVWLSRRALAPIDALIRETRAIGVEDLRQRLATPERDDELRDLVGALNGLLARLDDGFQALGNYAASASHELRTPLAVITSELEVALRRPRTAQEWEVTATASLDELRRLSRLVEALLALSRQGAEPLALGPVDLGESIERALIACAQEAKESRVVLVAPASEPSVWVHGNAELLGIALEELVRNAVRYTPGAGTVFLRCEEREDSGVALHVDDTGPGVAPGERATTLLPFTRGSAARAADLRAPGRRGFGLGLSTARRSVERCGGALRVGTSPEGGARFSLIFAARARPATSTPFSRPRT